MLRLACLVVLGLIFLSGCASPSSTSFDVPAGSYARAFDAARAVLRERGFTLDRVDAEEGVLTTMPKRTSGLATPWDSDQSSVSQEFEDMVHEQQRRVRITFVPNGDGSLMRASAGASGRVEVVLERIQLVGWQPSSKAILHSGFTSDPLEQARGRDARYAVPVAREDALAARLADGIRRRLELADAGQGSGR